MMGKIKKWIIEFWKDKNKMTTILMFVLSSVISAIIVDVLNKRSLTEAVVGVFTSPFVFIINTLIIMSTMSICLMFKRRYAVMATASAIWITLGIVNYVVMSNRVTPFSMTDLKLLGSIDDIIERYLTPFLFILIIVAIMLVIVAVAYIWVKMPKYAEKINHVKNLIIIIIICLVSFGCVKLGLATGSVSEKFPNMTVAYYDYGFPYCFTAGMFKSGVDQPDEYTKEAVKDIVNKMNNTVTVDKDQVNTPNIIFLQMESFFDVSKMVDVKFSADVTPIFNGMKDKYPSGYLMVNNVGYGTANTEFEIMTGLNLDDFGPGEFPYKTILATTTCESTAYILKNYDYVTHAIHNNTATFYSRDSVFKRLGYDTYTSIEYMNAQDFTENEWAKDAILTEEIIKALNATEEMDYIYAISVQGHGAYPTEPVLENPAIQVVEGIEKEDRKYMLEYYANMLYEMDIFIGELTEALSDLDEDVVLVIFGDHLPSLDISEKELSNANLYQTEYVVWNNMDLQMDDKDVEAYQLSSRVLQHLNIDSGYINKFHQTYADSEDYFEKMKLLSYDILYGNMFAYDGINPYIATDMKLGTVDVHINSVRDANYADIKPLKDMPGIEDIDELVDILFPESDEDASTPDDGINEGEEDITDDSDISQEEDDVTEPMTDETIIPMWYVVTGENFTQYSEATVNGKACTTVFISPTELLVNVEELFNLDIFVVNQKYGGAILSSSHEYTFFDIDGFGDSDTDESEQESE